MFLSRQICVNSRHIFACVTASNMVVISSAIRYLVWGPSARSDNQILRVNMANIRRKIEKNPAQPVYIFTEVGVGYRMIEGD